VTYDLRHVRATGDGAFTGYVYHDGRRLARVTRAGLDGPTALESIWGDVAETRQIEADLTAWVTRCLPDWFLAEHDIGAGESADWTLATAYLFECWELDQMALDGFPVRTPAGTVVAPIQHPSLTGRQIWHNHDWEAVF